MRERVAIRRNPTGRNFRLLGVEVAHQGTSMALATLAELGGERYVVGGAIRDILLGQSWISDVDLMVTNEDDEVHRILERFGRPRRNRHGNCRYVFPDGRHLDVIEPRFFYGVHATAYDALKMFDASVNAIGARLHDFRMLDPLSGIDDLTSRRVTLPLARWTSATQFEGAHLTVRLARLLSRHQLELDAARTASLHARAFRDDFWPDLERLNGLSRPDIEALVLSKLGFRPRRPRSR